MTPPRGAPDGTAEPTGPGEDKLPSPDRSGELVAIADSPMSTPRPRIGPAAGSGTGSAAGSAAPPLSTVPHGATAVSAASLAAVAPAEPSFGDLVQDASRNLSTLVHAEIELAKVEITGSVKKGVAGLVFFGAAAVLLVFSLIFLLVAVAEGLVALGVIRWLAYLILWAVLVLIAAVAAFIGLRSVKKVRKPERSIEAMKDNKGLLQRDSVGVAR